LCGTYNNAGLYPVSAIDGLSSRQNYIIPHHHLFPCRVRHITNDSWNNLECPDSAKIRQQLPFFPRAPAEIFTFDINSPKCFPSKRILKKHPS